MSEGVFILRISGSEGHLLEERRCGDARLSLRPDAAAARRHAILHAAAGHLDHDVRAAVVHVHGHGPVGVDGILVARGRRDACPPRGPGPREVR